MGQRLAEREHDRAQRKIGGFHPGRCVQTTEKRQARMARGRDILNPQVSIADDLSGNEEGAVKEPECEELLPRLPDPEPVLDP